MGKLQVINIMADGSICEDLSDYVSDEHPLPDLALRLIYQFIEQGHAILKQKANTSHTASCPPSPLQR